MTLPDTKIQTNFTEKPLAGKRRASDQAVMLDINNDSLLSMLSVFQAAVDGTTTALKTINYAHHEVHEGDHFDYISTQDLTNGQVISFVVVTPNTTKWAHFGFLLSAESEFSLDVYEGATPTANGTVVSAPAVINSNRNSTNVHTTRIYHTPTLGGGSKGTLIKKWHGGSGKQVGGTAGTQAELILKQNTKYWFDITNMTANNNFVDWIVEWYEHTNV